MGEKNKSADVFLFFAPETVTVVSDIDIPEYYCRMWNLFDNVQTVSLRYYLIPNKFETPLWEVELCQTSLECHRSRLFASDRFIESLEDSSKWNVAYVCVCVYSKNKQSKKTPCD